MGKRSSFERREADFYPTPQAAVLPLVPYLRRNGIRTFAEPCAGEGNLVRHLESVGLACVYQGDIRSEQDALSVDHYGGADAIITNPPWSRGVLHGLITHLQNIAPYTQRRGRDDPDRMEITLRGLRRDVLRTNFPAVTPGKRG